MDELGKVKSELQSSEKNRFEINMQLQKITKEKQVLSDMNLQL